jgi:hypothetical protein
MWSDNKVRELVAVKVQHTSLLNISVIAFKVLPLGSYVPMPTPSPPFKTILELVLWSGLQSCRRITPDVINVIKMPSFQCFFYLPEQKKVTGGLDPVNREGVPAQLFVKKNVKLSLCLIKYALRHEDVWGSGCIDPHFLGLGTSWR